MDHAHRAEDGAGIRITREIPLHWVLGVIGAIATQAVLLWSSQHSQGELIGQQARALETLTAEIKSMRADVTDGRIRVIEQAAHLAELERRVVALEERGTARR